MQEAKTLQGRPSGGGQAGQGLVWGGRAWPPLGLGIRGSATCGGALGDAAGRPGRGAGEALLQGPRPRRLPAPVLAHPTFLYLGLTIYTRLLTATLWGGWCQDRAEQGQGHRGWEGGQGGRARPKEPRPAWHQCRGDPAYLGAVLRTLAPGWLISTRVRQAGAARGKAGR